MGIFKRKNRKKQEINEEFIAENAKKVTDEDVEKVVLESDKIWSKFQKNGRFEKYLAEGKIMLSLIKDFWKKDYTNIPWYAMTAIVFSLLYVLNPMDLSPDYIPFIGYIDDVTVFSFALTLVNKDLNAYKNWKKEKIED
ncbi:MAG: YkvA family protein [Salibacteraceae bacterium]